MCFWVPLFPIRSRLVMADNAVVRVPFAVCLPSPPLKGEGMASGISVASAQVISSRLSQSAVFLLSSHPGHTKGLFTRVHRSWSHFIEPADVLGGLRLNFGEQAGKLTSG